MYTINIALNKIIATRMKDVLKKKGYNNISEYIRDLLRRDLNIDQSIKDPYDTEFLMELQKEAESDIRKKKIRKLSSLSDLIS